MHFGNKANVITYNASDDINKKGVVIMPWKQKVRPTMM